jgi:fimbrial chaperone protein
LARAAELQVEPVRIELSAQQRTAAVRIRNGSPLAATIRVQPFAWTHHDGRHVFTPTGDLLVSPSGATIAPGGEQVVRMMLRREPGAESELAYRVVVEEGPVQSTLRVNLTVFVRPTGGLGRPAMAWRLLPAPANSLKVELRNDGNAHVQVSDFALYVPGTDTPVARESVSAYVLAGQLHVWTLPIDMPFAVAGGPLRVKAYTDGGSIDTDITFASEPAQ